MLSTSVPVNISALFVFFIFLLGPHNFLFSSKEMRTSGHHAAYGTGMRSLCRERVWKAQPAGGRPWGFLIRNHVAEPTCGPPVQSASRLTVQERRRLRREACGGDSCGSARREARVHASPRLGQPRHCQPSGIYTGRQLEISSHRSFPAPACESSLEE